MAPRTREQWIADQTRPMPAVVTADLTGKTLVLIGANAGLGFEAAKHFARMNPARLVLTARDEVKGKEALTRIQQDTGYSKAELWIIDVANFKSVITFADKAERELDRLDILVENAGMATWEYGQVEGWERTLHTNNLGPGLLAIRMIPKMLETARKHSVIPRLVIVASDVHYWTKIEKDVIASPRILAKLSDKQYLLNVLFARSLQLHVPSSPAITVNSVNPGFCFSGLRTGIRAEEAKAMRKEEEELCFTTEEGSRQLVYGAVGSLDDEEKLRGKFIQMSEVVEESDFVISEDGKIVQDKVWEEMLDILGNIDPKVLEVANTYLQKT
ncbi:NAD(P)-binding protein [Guyanagaster necrorhizus]|uniref:NAD(P)-binding protein n=1 Tax=Guyanagaster necrorhizus TaxID=856835 RepID=A0A9P7VH66_9AGAR|nr:NAD(P)-binding protein [Guyanagaster necrorhizus MCA 3950]XP_043033795.1 NAD(P)-binding protein [Guyanagaster necrorhizus MCA 3950]KAG7439188.1 NAD(P)-binding protein [Guyanagaster necrorhizus MCA 3950]KAG7440295.1 NAD(P)-binding protein [Guyanagaster necrorhizus MCA 3950]